MGILNLQTKGNGRKADAAADGIDGRLQASSGALVLGFNPRKGHDREGRIADGDAETINAE